MDILLDKVEARVLGCLIEKERTTPEYYPLTKNSLITACNQKSNRDPEMSVTESVIDTALTNLCYEHKLVATVSQANSRVLKYSHRLTTHFDFDPEHMAVLCELLLRGSQTAGALRTHAKRMVEIASPAKVKEVLEDLMHWGEKAFVTRLPPARGMREERYAHLFCGEPESDAETEAPTTAAPDSEPAKDSRISELESKVADLETRLAAIEQALF